jgi:hypothetical protein
MLKVALSRGTTISEFILGFYICVTLRQLAVHTADIVAVEWTSWTGRLPILSCRARETGKHEGLTGTPTT